MLLSQGTEFKNNQIICHLKIYPPIRRKQLSVIFILNPINNLTDQTKICMTLIVPKNIQRNYFMHYVHLLDLFTALFVVI